MLSERMQEAINGQLKAELYSGYLYLSMSAYLSSIGLPGFARYMRVQRLEEVQHGLKFYDYIVESGGRVLLGPIDGPPIEWDSALAVAEAAMQHEKKVTGLINDLVKVAEEEGDQATRDFLQWYVKEQDEEEGSAEAVVSKIRSAGEAGPESVDAELGQRPFKPKDAGLAGGIG